MNTFSEEDTQDKINQLQAIINNSDNETQRIKSIQLLKEGGIKNFNYFKFVENLLISDANSIIRNLAVEIIKNNFLKDNYKSIKIFKALCWAYENECSIECLLNIISTIGEIDSSLSRDFLLTKLNNIEIFEFNNYITKLKQNYDFKTFNNKKLAYLLKNYHIVKNFIHNFELVSYRFQNGDIIELDFSFAYNNDFTNSIIKTLPKIMNHLKDLQSLNLKYNKLENIPRFIKYLTSLRFLNLSNNNIKKIPSFISKLSSLEYLDLSWNNIQCIPEEIERLKNIKTLNLQHNRNLSFTMSLFKLQKRGVKVNI
ncbi:MAG: leucine-rich repeat domain-containing protein [Promethearchaeota archaeon]|nr:MAG: leucine-rich repeat domain-containing protein [Candidatus Lokiarchaeota archaeon]